MMTSQYAGLVDDRSRVKCVTPPRVTGESVFDAVGASALPGLWHCGWGDVTIVTILATLSLAVVVLGIAVLRRRISVSSCLFRAKQRHCARSTLSATGSASSTVTISNGCYGNGSTGEGAGPQPLSVVSGSESRYSPLVEEDGGIQEFQTASNGHQFWPTGESSSSLSATAAASGDYLDCTMTSSNIDIKCPLIGNGSAGGMESANGGTGNHRTTRSAAVVSSGSRGVRNGGDARLIGQTGKTLGDIEDSL